MPKYCLVYFLWSSLLIYMITKSHSPLVKFIFLIFTLICYLNYQIIRQKAFYVIHLVMSLLQVELLFCMINNLFFGPTFVTYEALCELIKYSYTVFCSEQFEPFFTTDVYMSQMIKINLTDFYVDKCYCLWILQGLASKY